VSLLAVVREIPLEGDEEAALSIYDLSGALLAEHATGHAAPVTCIVFEGGGGGGGGGGEGN
jgi:hypothetical protein